MKEDLKPTLWMIDYSSNQEILYASFYYAVKQWEGVMGMEFTYEHRFLIKPYNLLRNKTYETKD